MSPVKIQTGYLPVEVEIWGNVYETADLTEAQEEKGVELYDEALSATKQTDAIDIWAQYLDQMLRPVKSGAKKPSTALKAEFKKGKITSRGVIGVILQIRAAEQGEQQKVLRELALGVRPT